MGKFAGGKFAGSHTTVIEPAEKTIRNIERIAEVTKITLSKIDKAGGFAPLRIKATEVPAGFRLSVRGGTFVQEVYIYCLDEDKETVRTQVEQLAPEHHDHARGGGGQKKREHVSAKNWRGD